MPGQVETRLQTYRKNTFRLKEGGRLRSVEDALSFVEERGFIYFWPIKGVNLPSLWTAVAGDRPVSDEHDDPGHVTWGWKDAMLDQKRWYYGKLLRRKATIVSLELIPYFYALSDRVGDLDDYMLSYEEGRLTYEEKTIADTLLNSGAQNTIELRRMAHLSATTAKSRFERSIATLQSGLYIIPVGIAEVGSWRYAYIYELFDRWYPQAVIKARQISRGESFRKLIDVYLTSVGASTTIAIGQLFRWQKDDILSGLEKLEREGLVRPMDGELWATNKLFS